MAIHPSPPAAPADTFDPAAFNPFAPDQLNDPYPIYAQARRDQPVFYSPLFDMWFVTRYDDITTVVRQPQSFSSAQALESTNVFPASVNAVLAQGYDKFQSLVQTDPPDHSRVRAVFGKALTPQRVAALEPRIRAITTELIDALIDAGKADLIPQFAFPLPGLVICDLLGLPRADLWQVKHGFDGREALMGATGSEAELVEAAHKYVALQQYFIAQIEQRVQQPQDDLLTLLVPTEIGGSAPLTMQEAVSNAIDLFAAGHETTTSLIANGLGLLLANPEQLDALRADPGLLPNAIEEMLRMESPVRGLFRITTSELELAGVQLPKGARLLVLYGSGNRDEQQFTDPDTFDPRRSDASKHLAFGKGIHFCIGSVLAKMEGRVAFEELLQRLPGLRLHPERLPVRRPFLITRSYDHFPIAWDVAPTR